MSILYGVNKIRTTNDHHEVNSLLSQGWVLLAIGEKEYVLGRIEANRLSPRRPSHLQEHLEDVPK